MKESRIYFEENKIDKKELIELRIKNRLERLDKIKNLSKKISKDIITDEINLSTDEVEDFLNLLSIDLKNLLKPTSAEIFLQEHEKMRKRQEFLEDEKTSRILKRKI